MRVECLPEPELEFAAGRHVDIRYGLMDYGPLDVADPDMRTIPVGVVGTNETIEGLGRWLERCRTEVPGKESKQPRLFPPFPGFQTESAFRSTLTIDPRHQRPISKASLDRLSGGAWTNMAVAEAVELFCEELEYLADVGGVDVVVCAVPLGLLDAMNRSDQEGAQPSTRGPGRYNGTFFNFRRLLKAKAMQVIRTPIQIVLPTTYDPGAIRKRKTKPHSVVRIQDEATRAWNLHTALYYKAGGTPWRMVRERADLDACYVGIAFYRSLDDEYVLTSMAQVFDERGEGLVVRGGRVEMREEDRTPHLAEQDANALLLEALHQYRREHRHAPARAVVHKSSRFDPGELAGFKSAAAEREVEYIDLVNVQPTSTRLFRAGRYPPLRGTVLHLDEGRAVLYTKGSVDFYRTYPGMYVPRPLLVSATSEQTASFLAREALTLTKMNWNNTQFDGGRPITLAAADRVGDVLKYLGDTDWVAPRFSYYM